MTEKSKPKDVDTYIAHQAEEAHPTLEELREIIKSTVPEVEEGISYNVPFYKFHGVHVGFAAYKDHASFGIGADVLHDKDRKLLEAKGYKTGKGTLQIKYNQDVPTTEIRRILKTKVNEAKSTVE